MATFILTFLFFLVVVAGMAVGAIFRNRPIKGSCGGMGALGLDTACDLCGGDPSVCEEETRATPDTAGSLFYPADKNS